MSALLKYEEHNPYGSPASGSCTSCDVYEFNICAAIRKRSEAAGQATEPLLVASVHTIPARRTISRPTEWSEFVPVICRGWASSTIALSDGRRQILSFLLAGDMVSTASPFESTSGLLVEAITEVTYRNFKRSDLKTALFEHPDLLEMLAKAWGEERRSIDQLAVDLGRRTADERIARLILNLMDRLAKRGMAQDQTMDFPLRQHHIADATGLTPVHVSKVLSGFRRSGLIDYSNRSLAILDVASFQRVANQR